MIGYNLWRPFALNYWARVALAAEALRRGIGVCTFDADAYLAWRRRVLRGQLQLGRGGTGQGTEVSGLLLAVHKAQAPTPGLWALLEVPLRFRG